MLQDMHVQYGVCGQFMVPSASFATHADSTWVDRVPRAMGTLRVGLLMPSSVYSCVHAHLPQVWGWEEKLQVVPHVCGHARMVECPAWACVAGPLCGLEADCGDLADLRRVVVGHAVKEEGGVSGVGRFHLVPYGVPIVGPCRALQSLA